MRTSLASVVLAFVLFAAGCNGIAYRMPTEGMRPTITPNDMCVANPFGYTFGKIERFDLVVFRPNEEQRRRFNDDNLKYLQRIIGMPNEKLEIRNNQIYINDRLIEEPFEKYVDGNDPKRNFGPILIPENEYFLLGDNRPNSEDSRYWKKPTISKQDIYAEIIEIKKDFYESN